MDRAMRVTGRVLLVAVGSFFGGWAAYLVGSYIDLAIAGGVNAYEDPFFEVFQRLFVLPGYIGGAWLTIRHLRRKHGSVFGVAAPAP